MLTREELIQKLQDQLVDHDDMNDYLEEKMAEEYPEIMDKKEQFENDEALESRYYGLRGELFLTLMIEVLGRLSGHKK